MHREMAAHRALAVACLAALCCLDETAARGQSRPRAEQRVSTNPRAAADLIVQLTACRSGDAQSDSVPSLACELRVTSRRKARYERVDCGSGLTKAVDDRGREAKCVEARLSGAPTGGLVGQEVLLPAGRAEKLELRFVTSGPPPAKLSLLRVALADDLDWSQAEFRDVPIGPSASSNR